MKYITAKKLINKMLDNKIVNLRGNKFKSGISQKTFNCLCDILHGYGYKVVGYKTLGNGFYELKADDFILSNKIQLF